MLGGHVRQTLGTNPAQMVHEDLHKNLSLGPLKAQEGKPCWTSARLV